MGTKQNIFPPTLKTSTSSHNISVVTCFKDWQYSVNSSIFIDTKLHNVYELLNFSSQKYLSLKVTNDLMQKGKNSIEINQQKSDYKILILLLSGVNYQKQMLWQKKKETKPR